MYLKFPGEPCNLEMLFQIFKMYSFALPGVCEFVLTFWLSIYHYFSLAAGLLRILCADSNIREQVKVFDGIPICLR